MPDVPRVLLDQLGPSSAGARHSRSGSASPSTPPTGDRARGREPRAREPRPAPEASPPLGVSNVTAWQLQLTVSAARAVGVQVPVTLQPQYSLVSREIEFEIVPAAAHNGIGLLPWSPLASGLLSDKYDRGAAAAAGTRAGSGSAMFDHIFADLAAKDQNWSSLDVVRDVAAEQGVSPSQAALS